MKLSATLFAMLAAGALVISACGGDDADESAPVEASELTLADRAYLGKVEHAFGRSDANFDEFNSVLAESFSSPGASVHSLVRCGEGG